MITYGNMRYVDRHGIVHDQLDLTRPLIRPVMYKSTDYSNQHEYRVALSFIIMNDYYGAVAGVHHGTVDDPDCKRHLLRQNYNVEYDGNRLWRRDAPNTYINKRIRLDIEAGVFSPLEVTAA